jgi:hypothetical protein
MASISGAGSECVAMVEGYADREGKEVCPTAGVWLWLALMRDFGFEWSYGCRGIFAKEEIGFDCRQKRGMLITKS